MTNATECEACNGCKHQNHLDDGWCYMFENAPDDLPCAQHDKFEVKRKVTCAIVGRHPVLLTGLALELIAYYSKNKT